MKAIELLTDNIKVLVAEYSAMSKLNHFLYKNEDCNKFMKTIIDDGRWKFVNRMNKIKHLIIHDVHSIFHNRSVSVDEDRLGITGRVINGRIIHELTREWEGRTIDNTISFRSIECGESMSGETIALWVDTNDKYSSHLFNIDKIEIHK